MLDKYCLALGAHVAVDLICDLHFKCFFAEILMVEFLFLIFTETYFLAVARTAVSSPTQS